MCEGSLGRDTYDAGFQFGRFSIKYVGGFDTVLDDSDGTVKETHQMTTRKHQRLIHTSPTQTKNAPSSLSCIISQHLTVLLSNSDKELVYRHGRVDGDFAAKEGLDVVFLLKFLKFLMSDWARRGMWNGLQILLLGHVLRGERLDL